MAHYVISVELPELSGPAGFKRALSFALKFPGPVRLENRQTITLAKHAVFDPGQLLLDNEGPGLGGKQLQRRAITQRGFGLTQPSRGIRGLSSEDLLGAGRDARDPDIVTYFSCRHWL